MGLSSQREVVRRTYLNLRYDTVFEGCAVHGKQSQGFTTAFGRILNAPNISRALEYLSKYSKARTANQWYEGWLTGKQVGCCLFLELNLNLVQHRRSPQAGSTGTAMCPSIEDMVLFACAHRYARMIGHIFLQSLCAGTGTSCLSRTLYRSV